jgi:hypothetical protein
MVYELSATTFSLFAYVVLTWTAIMALFIVGATLWQMNRAFRMSGGGQATQPVGDDD